MSREGVPRGGIVVVGAGLLCALVAGCGGGSSSPKAATPTPSPRAATPDPEDGDLEQLDALLGRRAAALAADRPRAYAATAAGAQRTRDREAARNARGLGLKDVELHVDSSDLAGRSARLRVLALYGVRGVRGRFATARRITARETAAGWRVVRDTSPRERHPWELGRVQARRTKHFVVLAPATLELGALTDALEGGYARMGDVLEKPRLRKRYLVVVAGGAHSARALTREHPRGRVARRDRRRRGAGDRAGAAGDRGRLAAAGDRVAAVQHARPRRSAARRHPRADPRGAGRDHLGAHARVARRGHRALRLR